MVSAFNDFDQCKDGWPIQPSCSRLIGFGIYTALAVLNLIVACMPRAMGGFLNTLRSYLWIPIQQYTTRELEVVTPSLMFVSSSPLPLFKISFVLRKPNPRFVVL
ncbi:hypothetical protein ANCDUO_24815 [Ancylostoma duodenale]|uniref:Uncharacterized protein n=1 Tax=Ancylostoma duodenale TaxID=51022 RepID=A0A0C2BMT5_9BILA|nr:hypothetical protein ANCDUO_24815 [Ancylostoma duodenale]